MKQPRLVLASRSPQREAILKLLGLQFEIAVADVEEIASGDPTYVVVENALMKARAIARVAMPDVIVIGADTVIVHGGDVIGKPRDASQAREFIARLQGTEHQVLGGYAVLGPDGQERTSHLATDVKFRALSDPEIDRYVATEEWRDRSGAYAIQQQGAGLVEEIHGDYLNIVGLSVVELLRLAPELGV